MTDSYSIAEAAEHAGVSVHTLRYYERAGLIAPVMGASSGHRRYTAGHLEWAIFLTYLRATGMPIRRMREYVDLFHAGPHTEPIRLALLEAHRNSVRAQLSEMEGHLARIERKIASYHDSLAAGRRSLCRA